MREDFFKIINFIKETGERVVFFHEGRGYFITSIENLKEEKSNNLNEKIKISPEEMIEKINRDIALWQQVEKERQITEEILNDQSKISQEITEESFYIEPVE